MRPALFFVYHEFSVLNFSCTCRGRAERMPILQALGVLFCVFRRMLFAKATPFPTSADLPSVII
jgi:hypothetical protein